ncbi:hypothetical protein AALP_AA1G281200 [Arabis alpina]|uniref:TIR domain-containing protein n=1 Tax=Arabis alpina TaxID=50452 RepID=A0A087HR59_ARAAL|nr:hypothetical protein AALP_AA1G281200 [Arabis alpina]
MTSSTGRKRSGSSATTRVCKKGMRSVQVSSQPWRTRTFGAMIGLLVKRVLAELSNTPENVGEYTVGLESRVEELMNLLDIESTSGFQILGLYGMGGIGKTTLAKAFYNKIVGNFEQRFFISNVRERSSDQAGLVNLQRTYISELNSSVPQIEDVNGGRDKIRESVHEKKILVVLDDIDNVDQVDALVGERRWYGEGSLIIITTRGEEILSRLSVNQQYEVRCLTETEALKLFCYHSLRKENPTPNLLELSKKIVDLTGLLPLAVEVFGSLLYDKKYEKEWQVQLEKLKNIQPNNLQDVLGLSFESLDDEEKKVFLDISCLFLKMEMTKEEVVDVLIGCGFNAEAALSVLRQKSLVKFLANRTLWMHDQIRDMGRQMDLKEIPGDPRMRSRLWDRGEIMTILNNMKGTTSIRGIVFDFRKKYGRDPSAEINRVELEGNLKLLPSALKWIQWKGCPLKNLPPDFLTRQLAVLDLSESGIRQVQTFCSKRVDENLKVVNLCGCHSLEAIPDLSNHKALEKLLLRQWVLLVKVPRSVGNLTTLLHLDLKNCSKLTEFLVDVSGLKSLEKIILCGCSNLRMLPENIGAMPCLKELRLDGTAIKNLPESIYRLQKLEKLSLRGCSLPSSLEGLSNLRELLLYDCRELKCLPPLPWKVDQLNVANCFALESISDLSKLEILHELNLTNCEKVDDIPGLEKLTALKRLYMTGCNSSCSVAVKKRLSKVSLKMLQNLSLPGNRIPDWFSQGPVRFSAQPNRELRGVILAVVVALNHETKDYQLPSVVEIQAQILKLDRAILTHTLYLCGVPITSNDQLHICRYPAFDPMVTKLKDGNDGASSPNSIPKMETVAVSRPGSRLRFDVFLSFRGEDTRHSITERVYDALHRKEKVRVFLDNDGMQKGDEIQPSLIAAIEDSAASVVVLSRNYANSRWCLDELAMLCDLRASSLNRPMIPIFYEVDPSHVRKQSDHFAKDFEEHSKRFSEEKIKRWKGAMELVGNLSGFVCSEFGKNASVDDAMVGLVVKRVLAELSNTPEKVGEYTVGLESRVDDLMRLIDFKSSSGLQILGLYGMGGIGKTTLAKAFYNKIVGNFEQRVFISNVRESSSDQGGLVNLQKTYINELFQSVAQIEDVKRGREKIRESVHEKKILAVLDDVDNVDQVDALVGERRWYGEGSLILITTRDEEILTRLSVNQQYEVRCLTEMQALKLFSYHSLRKDKPTESLLELSKKIVQITGRLPLAVEVFGSLLYDKKEEKQWQAQLDKLNNTQPNDLQDVLALSFKSLDDEEKKVFLDIACLLLKMERKKEEVVDILKGCGFNAEAALSVLRQKSLLKIMADNALWMHDQIRDMGRQMVLKESREDPGMRSRLWDRAEIMTVLNNNKGTTSIRGIVFDLKKKYERDTSAESIALGNSQKNPGINSLCSFLKNIFIRFQEAEKPKSSQITIPVKSFVPMKKLRLLQINNVELEGSLKRLPSTLKWIQWKGCPLINLPPDFLAGQLAVLDLSESGIRRVQSLSSNRVDENLKVVNLRGCYRLEAIPDLSNHKALEKLVFEQCNLLVKVPISVGNLRALLHLDFRGCLNLSEFLVDVSGLKRLEKLILSGCSSLSVLPENIGAMRCLKILLLDGTAIKNVPDSIYRLQKLEKLSLRGCRSIQEIPICVGTLTSLEELNLSSTALENLPSSIGCLKNLQKLDLVHCASLSKIPDTINKLILLKELFIYGSAVEELPLKSGSLPSLIVLSAGGCNFLKQVPSSIGGLNSLLQLKLDNTPIETLPEEISNLHFIRELELMNCKSLKFLPESIGAMDTLRSLYLEDSDIEELPESFGKLENLVLLRMNKCKMLKRLPNSFGDLKSLHHLHMQEILVADLPESFGNLSNLMVLKMLKKPLFRSSGSDASGTSEEPRFVEVPDSFSNLLSLEELDARSWGISGKIPDVLEKLSSLKILNLGNNYFHSLPASLEGLSSLKELLLYDCRELKCLPPLPWNLEQLNLGNCFSLESISDLSELTILHELNLTNCEKVDDIPGLEKLTALRRLYMSGCNSICSFAVKKRLSKASLKMLHNLSLPGNRIPDWFLQGPITFSAQPNRELKAIILAVVVALNHETGEDYQLPAMVEIQAQIVKVEQTMIKPKYIHTLNLYGVPRTSNDQLHICRYSAPHSMVTTLEDGYTIQVIKIDPPLREGVELKMHGIYLVYEGDDDLNGEEDILTETQQTISQKLANFFSSFKEGEASSEGESTTVT